MTVGQELTKTTGYRLFHNHMPIELSRKLFAPNETEEFKDLVRIIRQNVFEMFATRPLPGLIYTNMCAFDDPKDIQHLTEIIDLFQANGIESYVVELCADFDVRLDRNKSENRLLHKESKRNLEWSEAEMRATSQEWRLNSYDGEELPFTNFYKIDNTNIPPDEVANMIIKHFELY